ncbi:putative porin [candidate division KSB1 bacterium]|nr:putative porin [candidate division KSB1 bacterium]
MHLRLRRCIALVASLWLVTLVRAEAPKPWSDRITLSGDFRYRHESITEHAKPDRHRHRLRVRFATMATINERLEASLRLASGKGEPVSTNQDLGGGSGQKGIWIDRAFLEMHPAPKISLFAGKFGVPLESTDLIWDTDLNLEGAAGRWKGDPKQSGLLATAGGFWLTESATQPDQGLLLAQTGYRIVRGPRTAVLALAYADYQNLKHHAIIGGARGNRVAGSGSSAVYVSDFNLAELSFAGTRTWSKSTLSLLGEYVVNMAASESNSARVGALAGVTYKRKLSGWDWDVGYHYRRLAKDAAVGEFADSDFIGGGTNGSGHSVTGTIWPMANTLCRVRYLLNRIDPFDNGADRAYGRLMADIEVKF